MLHQAPTTISSSSARRTDPYHTLAARPSVPRPTTTAPGATHASGWIDGSAAPAAAPAPPMAPTRPALGAAGAPAGSPASQPAMNAIVPHRRAGAQAPAGHVI